MRGNDWIDLNCLLLDQPGGPFDGYMLSVHPRPLDATESLETEMFFGEVASAERRSRISASFHAYFDRLPRGHFILEASRGSEGSPEGVSISRYVDTSLCDQVDPFLREERLGSFLHVSTRCIIQFGHDMSVLFWSLGGKPPHPEGEELHVFAV